MVEIAPIEVAGHRDGIGFIHTEAGYGSEEESQ